MLRRSGSELSTRVALETCRFDTLCSCFDVRKNIFNQFLMKKLGEFIVDCFKIKSEAFT